MQKMALTKSLIPNAGGKLSQQDIENNISREYDLIIDYGSNGSISVGSINSNSIENKTNAVQQYCNLCNSINKFAKQNARYYKSAEEFINASGLSAFILTMIRTNPGATTQAQQKYMFIAGMAAAFVFYLNESVLQLAQHYKKNNQLSRMDTQNQQKASQQLLQHWDLISQYSLMILKMGEKGAFILEYLAQAMGAILGLLNHYKADSIPNNIYYSIIGGFGLIGVVITGVVQSVRPPKELKQAIRQSNQFFLQSPFLKSFFSVAKKLKVDTMMRLITHAASYHTFANTIINIAIGHFSLESLIKTEAIVVAGATGIALPITYFDDKPLMSRINRGLTVVTYTLTLVNLLLELNDDDVLNQKTMFTFFLMTSAIAVLGPLALPLLAKCIEAAFYLVKQINAQLFRTETNSHFELIESDDPSVTDDDLDELDVTYQSSEGPNERNHRQQPATGVSTLRELIMFSNNPADGGTLNAAKSSKAKDFNKPPKNYNLKLYDGHQNDEPSEKNPLAKVAIKSAQLNPVCQ